MTIMPSKPGLRALLLGILGSALATFLTGFIYAGLRWPLLLEVWATAGLWYLNFLAGAFAVAWIVRRLSFDRTSKPIFFLAHFVAGVLVSAMWTALAFLDLKIYAHPQIERYLRTMYAQYFNIGLVLYAAIAAWMYAVRFHRKSKEQAVAAVDLKRLAREAELRALKAQINPHFLFNALNSVNATVIEHPEIAREITTRLGSILRYALDGSGKEFVTLKEELDFVRDYLRIEKLRLGDRLESEVNVEESLLEVRVPPMTLEPLVENAVKHGVASHAAGGLVAIHICAEGDRLCYRVIDTGAGPCVTETESLFDRGMGLRNTLERLKRLYDDRLSFHIEKKRPSGCEVTMSIPLEVER